MLELRWKRRSKEGEDGEKLLCNGGNGVPMISCQVQLYATAMCDCFMEDSELYNLHPEWALAPARSVPKVSGRCPSASTQAMPCGGSIPGSRRLGSISVRLFVYLCLSLSLWLSACVCLLFFLEVLHHPARLRSEGRHPRHARYSAATYVDSNSGDSSDSERVRGNAVNLVSNTLSCRHRLCASRDFVIQPRLGQRCLQHVVILKVDFGLHLCCTSFRL